MRSARRLAVIAASLVFACAIFLTVPSARVAAQTDGGARDGATEAATSSRACKLSVAGATYAYTGCTVRFGHHEYLSIDGGVDSTPRVFITASDPSASVDLWFHVIGEPTVGPTSQFVMVGLVEKPPARWRVIANFSGTTGSADLTLTDVRKIRVDRGMSYEMHGTFVATMPEVTGVRGPDVVLSGTF